MMSYETLEEAIIKLWDSRSVKVRTIRVHVLDSGEVQWIITGEMNGRDSIHSTCNSRFKKERGEAKCCWCKPHKDCDFFINNGKNVAIL